MVNPSRCGPGTYLQRPGTICIFFAVNVSFRSVGTCVPFPMYVTNLFSLSILTTWHLYIPVLDL